MSRVLAASLWLAAFSLISPPGQSAAVSDRASSGYPSARASIGASVTTVPKTFTEEARRAAIRMAQIWAPTDVAHMDVRLGPQGPGAFLPGQMVNCDYVEAPKSGNTRKFDCAVGRGDVVKVRYGEANGHVQGSVLATRLLWALGFGADRVYPVRVTCRGCSSDPWNSREPVAGAHVFDPAVIERKPAGHVIKTGRHTGWSWSELDGLEEAAGGAPKEQRDALKLLVVFLQHTDNKPEQQRLICLPGGLVGGTSCDKPFMFVHDVGLTFGRANWYNRQGGASVNLKEWSRTRIWRDAEKCIGHLDESSTGTLTDPRIGEGGRKFLADLLVRLTDRQLRDLFEVARIDRRNEALDAASPSASVAEWVAAFKHKRDEIVTARCRP